MKGNKNFIAIILVVVMFVTMFAACGSDNNASEPDNSTGNVEPANKSDNGSEQSDETEQKETEEEAAAPAPEPKDGETYRVGSIDLAIVDTPTTRARNLATDIAFEAAGMEQVTITLTEYGDEAFLTGYESLCKQDVDAIICFTLSETVLPLLKDMFEEYDVKFFLANRKISDDSIRDLMLSSPMCIGNDHCNETEIAYELTQYLHEEYEVENIAVIGLASGDVNGDYRDAGIEAACEDFGINLLSETRGIVTTEDVTNSVEGFIASYPELDGIFIVGGSVTHGALSGVNQALINHNMQDKVTIAMVDIAGGMSEYMDDGPLKIVAGGNLIPDFVFSFVALANELMGTPLSNESYILNTQMFYITSSAEAEDYDKYIEGDVSIFTSEEYEQMLYKWVNDEVTLESVQDILDNFSVKSVEERHADLF